MWKRYKKFIHGFRWSLMRVSLLTVQCKAPEGPSTRLTGSSDSVVLLVQLLLCDLCEPASCYLVISFFAVTSSFPAP